MAGNSTPKFESLVKKIGSSSIVWELKNWKETHDVLVAGKASCTMNFEEEGQGISLRLFLRPFQKTHRVNKGEMEIRYYSLCADVLESNLTGVVRFSTDILLNDRTSISGGGRISISRSKKESGIAICEQFIAASIWKIDPYGERQLTSFLNHTQNCKLSRQQDIRVNISGSLFTLDLGYDAEVRLGEPEVSMLRRMKIMYAAEDNFSDLKLETKDNMTLSAHKFQLAATSPVFRAMIEEGVKKQGFDGVIQMDDVNGKPLTAILHWIYTGELHENAGNVMEEVVEAAVKYQLGDLLKVLDKKLIEICNAENMFRLFKIAKEIPMPTAIQDISLFIKDNL